MTKFLKIGVIGGAGPMASVFLCQKIFSLCQKHYNSCDYSDFPEVVLISYPFTRGDASLIQKDLQDLEKRLLNEGVDVFCIASHSFHGYFKPLTALKFLSLADLTYSRFENKSTPLVLAAQTTIDLKLYEKDGKHVVYPDNEDQHDLQNMIREIAGGHLDLSQIRLLSSIINKATHQHKIDCVVLACTELPLLLNKFELPTNLELIDSIEVLAKALVL